MTLCKIAQENGRYIIKILGFKITFKKFFLNQLVDCCCITNLEYFKKQGTQFPHPVGIVIAKNVKIGKNCKIFQNVTIGSWNNTQPIIGNNVTIFANSVIIGDVKIGDNVIVGAGSIVTKSVEDDCVIAGNPAKVINKKNKNN